MASAVAPPENSSLPAHLIEHELDPRGHQRGYIKGTDYSLPYSSPWARIHHKEIQADLLRHINCGYLSTAGIPPTLLALKQHAQSLCILIHALNPTLKSAEIIHGDPSTYYKPLFSDASGKKKENQDPLEIKYELNAAFDFLNDISVPYTNDDPNHHIPLVGLLNEIRGAHEGFGTDSHCPLMTVKPRGAGEPVRMYANHHNLVMHANACLERLDHEYSPVGGLMGLLPVQPEDPEGADISRARASLLGQWLLFTQHLVGRMHELERSYGNALDALAGEAVVPYQHVSSLGPDVRSKGREIAYPQDRYILVNSGDNVFQTIHDLLDKQEEIYQAKAEIYRRNGVLGDSNSGFIDISTPLPEGQQEEGDGTAPDGVIISPEDGKAYARGLIPLTLPTRFYRLAGQGRNTIFILPAYTSVHPNVEYTVSLEDKPTIVSSFQPAWPKRASEFEKDYRTRLERMQLVEGENARLKHDTFRLAGEVDVLRKEVENVTRVRDFLLLAVHNKDKTTASGAGGEKKTSKGKKVGSLEEKYARIVEDMRQKRDHAENQLRHEKRNRENAERNLAEEIRVRQALAERLIAAGKSADVGEGDEEDEEDGDEIDAVVDLEKAKADAYARYLKYLGEEKEKTKAKEKEKEKEKEKKAEDEDDVDVEG